MINNEGKVAVIFGVRNESSIAWDVALKLHRSGCKVALSYMADTKAEVLHLMEQNGMDAAFAAEVDVRNEEEITAFIKAAHDGLGRCGDVGMVAKGFARMHVADVQFDQRHARALDASCKATLVWV